MDRVEVIYTKEEVQKSFEGFVKSPHAKLISKTIVDDLMTTSNGVKNLLLALQGVEMKLEDYGFKMNESVIIDIENISTWNMNIDLMKEKQIILNNTISGVVTNFDRTKSNCIGVTFTIYTSAQEKESDTHYIRPRYLKKTIL